MEDARCKAAAVQVDDPRGKGLFTGVEIEMEDHRCKGLSPTGAFEMEDSRCWSTAIETEDPRCGPLTRMR